MPDETIGGRYRLLEPLGRGAMSAVWLAHDDELERQVAVKMLAPSADRGRFEREARAAAALSHPNICSLYDYGEADGRPYMVLEYLPQGSLEERLRDGRPLPDDETLRVAVEIASGLAHAHERGLVHRDLKPANILFDAEGRAKIADFGIARMGGSGTLTEAGTVLGTASYISPEQADGRPAGPASDVYSLGVILFRMLTGALPFHSANAMELVRMHRDDPPPAVTDRRADAPPRLAGLVAASLAKDPAARPENGAAVLRELRAGETTTPLAAGGVAAGAAAASAAATRVLAPRELGAEGGSGSRPLARRSRTLPAAALAALLLAAGGAAAVILTHGSSGGQAPPVVTQTSTAGQTSTRGATTAPSTTTARPTTDQTTTARTETAKTSTASTTAARATTTRGTTTSRTTTSHTTTRPATTAATTSPTTSPTTTAATTTGGATTTAQTTTAATTTAATTTDQGGTTTAP